MPDGGNTVVQAPGDKLTVKTGIVEEVSKVEVAPPKPVKSIAGTVAAVSIISTAMQKIDKNKAGNASTILDYFGIEFVRDGKLMQDDKFTVPDMDMTKLRKGMKISGKAFVAAGHVCLTASKAATFFSKIGRK